MSLTISCRLRKVRWARAELRTRRIVPSSGRWWKWRQAQQAQQQTRKAAEERIAIEPAE